MTAVAAGSIEAHRAAGPVRAALWLRLADLLSYPVGELVAAYVSGELRSEVVGLLSELPYPLEVDLDALAGGEGDAGDDLGPEFLRCFELPGQGHPVPLYGGLYGGDRRQVMEELLRFYRHFGLSTAQAPERDLPDSIPTVCEFLAYLAGGEAEAEDPTALRTAQRDLLTRQVTRWTGPLAARLARREPHPLHRAAVELFAAFAAAEVASL